jgi:hypothetical protein
MSKNFEKPKLAVSPDRNINERLYIERCKEQGEEPDVSFLELLEELTQTVEKESEALEWANNNLEYDLRSTKWICDKVKSSEKYGQNLYAAMCNMQFIKLDVIPILNDQRWSCSWRHAGSIIANMNEQGDYLDWYCSGIASQSYIPDDDDNNSRGYVPEGEVTDEIFNDLKQLGWVPVEWNKD